MRARRPLRPCCRSNNPPMRCFRRFFAAIRKSANAIARRSPIRCTRRSDAGGFSSASRRPRVRGALLSRPGPRSSVPIRASSTPGCAATKPSGSPRSSARRPRRSPSRSNAIFPIGRSSACAAAATPFGPDGIRVQEKPAINRHPLFLDGSVEVQDEGSQLLCHLVAPKRGEMVVDFCAGAGGKTLALGALMRSTGRLYAFDISPKRLAGLKPRLARSGLSNVHPQRIEGVNDARVKRLAGKIDRVLVDAPCSGLGTLRRNPDMKWRQTPEDVAELVKKQRSILASAARLENPGGPLVSATCSILEEENRGVVEDFLRNAPFVLRRAGDVLEKGGIRLQMEEYLELWPHRHGTDGFFAVALERVA